MLTLAIVSLLHACGSSTPADSAPSPTAAALEQMQQSAQYGLEARWWVVDDTDGVLARRLTEASNSIAAPLTSGEDSNAMAPSPALAPDDLQRLKNLGFRAFVLNADQAMDLQARTPGAAPIQRRWMGQVSTWSVLVRGRERGPTQVEFPDGMLDLSPGRLRMLVRAWFVPDAASQESQPARAVLRVEVVPQHEDGGRETGSAVLADDLGRPAPIESNTIEREGILFQRALLSASLADGQALVLVPEGPNVDWSAIGQPSDGGPRTGLETSGPAPARPPSLGELTLSDIELGRAPRLKIVLVLVAKVPPRFSLL